MNSVEVIELKPKRQPISVILQVIFAVAVLISGIMTLLSAKWIPLLYAMLTLTLGTMAWNNYKLVKRKWVAIIYVGAALITLVSTILEFL